MERIKSFALVGIIFICLSGCSSSADKAVSFINDRLDKQKKEFEKYLEGKDLFNHFPERIKDTSVRFFSSPPTSPPSYECIDKQYGIIYLFQKLDTLIFETNLRSYIYKTNYCSDSLLIINQKALNRESNVNKANISYHGRYPIPYFEGYDFEMGSLKNDTTINGKTYFHTVYNIPQDLKVYVFDAEAGDFWKVNCSEARPESLKEWRHGYSKGFATSKKKNLVVFWTMIW